MVIFRQNFPLQSDAPWCVRRPENEQSYSGLTNAGPDEHLLVHDTKCPEEVRVSSFNGNSGTVERVEIDWSQTSQPQDLEAVSYVDGQKGQFMAVEGSRYRGRTPHLFLFDYASGKGESLQRFDLPKLPYEIEGMVTRRRDDGDVLVMLGGRGDEETGEGRLHWALYCPERHSLEWSRQGREGIPVTMPEHIAGHERPIADLHLTSDGELWAAGCVDNGNYGPFESIVYRVGRLDANAAVPVTLTEDRPIRVRGDKIEALDSQGDDSRRLLLGSDNEACGGSLQTLLSTPRRPANASQTLLSTAQGTTRSFG